jgi:aryl-alcohol dehydrogenase-like predicted oxidoreductase
VTSAIFGARTIEQLDGCLAAADIVLSADEMKRLDEASTLELGYPYEMIGRLQGRW